MKKTLLYSLSLLALGTCMVSCREDDSDAPDNIDNPRGSIELTEAEATIMKSNRSFSFKLLDAANNAMQENEQFVLSPMSASFALSMLLNGAGSETLENSLNELGLSGNTIEELNAINHKLLGEINTLDKRASIEFANSLWLNDGSTPETSYINTIKEFYNGSVQNKDFANAGTLKSINNWCSNVTKGNIKELLKELDPKSKMLLINALYFKAPWEKKFKSSNNDVFNTISGEQQQVAYMENTLYAKYYDNGKSNVVTLPYGNSAFNFSILLPNEGVSLDECIAELANEDWIAEYEYPRTVELSIKMPKFEVKGQHDFVSVLKAMGITEIFKENADYSKMFPTEQFVVNNVLQATTFKVDENGSEGSAATVVGGFSAPSGESVNMVVNRPFLFFVRESSTGAILFIGKVGKI